MFRYGVLLLAIVVGVMEGGPKAADGWQMDRLFGADPATLCNGGTDQDTFKCYDRVCGDPYTGPKPVASGGIWNTYWQNDKQVCNNFGTKDCPLTYSQVKTNTECTQRNSP